MSGFDPVELSVRFFVLAISLTLHEFCHAYAAYRLGDDTAARAGRLSLNPLVHLDFFGSLMIFFQMPVGWAKPVPVNPLRLHNPRRDGSLVALAGPASNLALGTLFCAIFFGLNFVNASASWFDLMGRFIQVNFALAIFNLLPLYPLDGSKVLPLFLSPGAASRYEETMERLGFWPLLAMFLIESRVGAGPLTWWFGLWNPLLRPIFRLFGVSEY